MTSNGTDGSENRVTITVMSVAKLSLGEHRARPTFPH